MRYRHLLVIWVFLLPASLFSQDSSFIDKIKVPTFIDTLFIDHDLNNWSIRFFTNYKDNRFKLVNEEESILYAPHNPMGFGFGVGTRKLLLDLAFNIKTKDKEPTERFDFQANLMLRNHYIDYSLQTYHGFSVNMGDRTEFRPDISSFSSRLIYMYNFNAHEYSLAALKSGLSWQKKPAFTFGIGGFLFFSRVSADSSIVSLDMAPRFNEEARITNLPGIGAGILSNLSITIPFWKKFIMSASIVPGIGLMYKTVETDSISYNPKNPMLYQLGLGGMLGYNADKFYINLSSGFGLNGTSLDFGNRIVYNTANAKLAIGYKIGKARGSRKE
jgi:hypothetical protein